MWEKTGNMHHVLCWVWLLLLHQLPLMASALRTVSHTHTEVSCANFHGTDFIWYGSADSKAAVSSCHSTSGSICPEFSFYQHSWLGIYAKLSMGSSAHEALAISFIDLIWVSEIFSLFACPRERTLVCVEM